MTSTLLVAALLSFGTPIPSNGFVTAPIPAVATIDSPAPADATCLTLPGVPSALAAKLAGDHVVVSWEAPKSSGCTSLTGYVVVVSSGDPLVVDAGTNSVTLPSRADLRVAVAAMNEVGSSLPTPQVVASGGGERRSAGQSPLGPLQGGVTTRKAGRMLSGVPLGLTLRGSAGADAGRTTPAAPSRP